MPDDKIALYFAPTREGDHIIGLPARDLTEAEVAEYGEREAALLVRATAPDPFGRPLYQKTKPTGARAETIEANKATVAAGPTVAVGAPAPDSPAEE